MIQSIHISDAEKQLTPEKINELKTLEHRTIDTSDIPELTKEDFMKMYRPIKKQLSIRLDADVLLWLKSFGKGYQSRINTILRQAMNAAGSKRSDV